MKRNLNLTHTESQKQVQGRKKYNEVFLTITFCSFVRMRKKAFADTSISSVAISQDPDAT